MVGRGECPKGREGNTPAGFWGFVAPARPWVPALELRISLTLDMYHQQNQDLGCGAAGALGTGLALLSTVEREPFGEGRSPSWLL